MASLSIAALVSYFSGEHKSLDRGENHYKSDHVQSFSLRGEIHASKRNEAYKVTVSYQFVNSVLFSVKCFALSVLKFCPLITVAV